MNAHLLLHRMKTLSVRQLLHVVVPRPINELLYISKESSVMCPHRLPHSVSIKSFSIEHLSGLERIDKRLTTHRVAYVVFDREQIIHENWVSFDTLLPSQYGFDSRIPVVGDGFTKPQYRGNGICPYALSFIIKDLRDRNISSNAYTLVSPANNASIRAVEKAGFQPLSHLKGTRLLGCFIFNKSMIKVADPQPILQTPPEGTER
jgi:RimJ/RimL family protein N-acetyltransferase